MSDLNDKTQIDEKTQKEPLEKLLNIDETAKILGRSKATLYTWICRKKIEFVKISNRVMFEQDYIREFIKKRIHKPLEVCEI